VYFFFLKYKTTFWVFICNPSSFGVFAVLVFFVMILILLSFESNAMEMVIDIHHPQITSVSQAKQQIKLMNVNNQYKQNKSLKMLEGEGRFCSRVFCTSK